MVCCRGGIVFCCSRGVMVWSREGIVFCRSKEAIVSCCGETGVCRWVIVRGCPAWLGLLQGGGEGTYTGETLFRIFCQGGHDYVFDFWRDGGRFCT